MTKNLYVDIHVLQTVPSSNVNRDDTGSPKTAVYGGVTRSRVSSQSWKRAIRKAFQDDVKDKEWLEGYRTLRAVNLIAQEIQKLNSEISSEDAVKKANDVLNAGGIKTAKDKKDNELKTKALLLISKGQINGLAKYALEHEEYSKDEKKDVKKLLQENNSLDLALFGRMVADDPELNVDASTQVAHALSTHEIVPEFDYYTALDDAQNSNNAGSAMIGTLEYNSATLYRYANVNIIELAKNLGKDLTVEGLKLFLKEFITSMPTGKQNSFANKTLPSYVMMTVREDTPVNLVSAFETPVTSRNGYMQKSIATLEEENKNISGLVEDAVVTEVWTNKESSYQTVDSVKDAIDDIAEVVSKDLEDENTND